MNGILQNPIYRGLLVWNRHNFDKHPATGRRVIRPNESGKWIEQEVPHLRIISDDLWNAVQKRRAELRRQVAEKSEPYTKFNFVILCDTCGSKMISVCQTYLRCYNAKRIGICEHGRKVRRDALVKYLFEIVRDFALQDNWDEWRKGMEDTVEVAKSRISEIDTELEDLRVQSDNLLTAITEGIKLDDIVSERLSKLNQTILALSETRQSLVHLSDSNSVELNELTPIIQSACSYNDQLMFVDTIIGSVKVGRNIDGTLRLSKIAPDFSALGDLLDR